VSNGPAGAVVAMPWWVKPMNSQASRLKLTRQLIERCAVERIVETGTYLGTTTEFFAQFGVPVITAESDVNLGLNASQRLKQYKNVRVRVCDSVKMLKELIEEPIDRSVPTLFYLDAHWHAHLPLREEIEIVTAHFARALILVDDFAVPHDPGYGYDDYGPGKALTLDYLRDVKTSPLTIYFPSTRSQRETGARRGCVVVTANDAFTDILDKMPLLRRHRG
jgi:hypothetical protein